jgi:hypothetical protein
MKFKTKGVAALLFAVVSCLTLVACTDPMNAMLTVDNYNSIVADTTTYTQVVELFGEPTDDQALTDGAGAITWSNKDESITVTVTFADSIVTSKAQTGLI